MTVAELKAKVDTYRKHLKERKGAVVMTSENGPIGISIIEDLLATLESQQAQIDELKKQRTVK